MHIKPWLLAAVLAITATGCASQSTGGEVPVAEVTPVIETPEVEEQTPVEAVVEETVAEDAAMVTMDAPASATPIYDVEIMTHSDSAYNENQELLARYNYNLPCLTTEDVAGQTVADGFNANFVKWEEGNDFAQMIEWAQEQYTFNMEQGYGWEIYYEDSLDTTVYQTQGLVSVSGLYYSFTGGAHPNTVLLSWLFDMTTGTFISPLSLAKDPQAFADAVAAELIAYIQSNTLEGYPLEELYWDDYQGVLSGWDSYCVYFDEEGMHVGFSPYELAAYAAGSQEFTLTYETILPYLSDTAVALLELEN